MVYMSFEGLRNKLFYLMDLQHNYSVAFECEQDEAAAHLMAILKKEGTVETGFVLITVANPTEKDFPILIAQATDGIEMLKRSFAYDWNLDIKEDVRIYEKEGA